MALARKKLGQVWLPLPGPQTQALQSKADYLFYGGAGGGGKTDLIIGLALTAHKKSIIFRREFPQLRDVLLRTGELLEGTNARYSGLSNMWRDIPGGRKLEFGSVPNEDDKNRYKGRPHDLKAFDEVSDMTESQFRFLSGWARTTDPHQRVRVVCAGNPPTSTEGEWVIRFWAPWLDSQHPNPARPGELRWFAVIAGEDIEVENGVPFDHKGELIRPQSRSFIPARLTDNPYLMATNYGATMQSFPEPLRSQMLYGDFSVGVQDNPWQVIPTEWVRLAQKRWTDNPPVYTDEHGITRPVPMTTVGVDVARGGKDKTVLAKRYGQWVAPLERHPGSETPNGPLVAALVESALTGQGQAQINVDVLGVGTSVYDILAGAHPYTCWGVNFAEGSDKRDRSGRLGMINTRAAAYWGMRERLDPALGENIALPPDNELLADLCSPRWALRAQGIVVEQKEEIIKRIGRSPDAGDAVVLSFLEPPLAGPVAFASNPFYGE
jgi:hypothetical protein